jgi:CheY-like chemotaxis protein
MTKKKDELRILIVDDDEKSLRLLASKLWQLGFRDIIKCREGNQAVSLAKIHFPDLVFLDIMMPEMDGGEVKQLLNQNCKTKNIPIIFVSAIISRSEAKRMERLVGGDIIIAKPYSSEDLSDAINEALAED